MVLGWAAKHVVWDVCAKATKIITQKESKRLMCCKDSTVTVTGVKKRSSRSPKLQKQALNIPAEHWPGVRHLLLPPATHDTHTHTYTLIPQESPMQ